MSDENSGRVEVVEFWRAVELFAPQHAPRIDPDKHVYGLREAHLPWHAAHPINDTPLREKQARQHVVYCGVYSLEDVFGEIRGRYPSEHEVYDERPSAGYSALAAFVLDEGGRPIPGSQVVASCAWACARALGEGPGAVATGSFERVAAAFRERFGERFLDDEEDDDEDDEDGWDGPGGEPFEREELGACLELVRELLGLDKLAEDAALRNACEIRIKSRRVSRREARQPGERELLNSFYASDLALVAGALRRGDCGRGLREYLTSAQHVDGARRIDVERDLAHVRRTVAARGMPRGRWPAACEERLALGQQFALNTILTPGERRLFAVNGPPGTGKTAMLRDLLAANVVQRAQRLAELEQPSEAFVGKRVWTAEPYNRVVHCLRSELTGFEMVLACATNAAAENVTVEIPARAAIDEQWDGEVDYFARIATTLLENGGEQEQSGCEAWALVSAALGKSSNNRAFVTRFWFEGLRGPLYDMQEPALPWAQAVADFREACAFAEQWRENFGAYSDVFERLEEAERTAAREQCAASELATQLAVAQEACEQAKTALTEAQSEQGRWAAQHRAHAVQRPGLWQTVRSFGADRARWQAAEVHLAQALAGAESAVEQAGEHEQQTCEQRVQRDEQAAAQEQRRAAAQEELGRAQQLLEVAREKWCEGMPDVPFPDEHWARPEQRTLREQHTPWVNEDWNDARTRVFLAALELHRAFVEGAAQEVRQTLAAMMDVLLGKTPGNLDPVTALAAWQCLFLVVPLLSTTFASLAHLLRHVGREAVGWLLIDEAGQAPPQSAVGAIWRARHTVAVGDPLQLEPIDPLPLSIRTILREHNGVPAGWLPANPSVQALADQVAPAGTWRGGRSEEAVWVGAPLNVHRRCEEPMFTIVNGVAYQGQMINCTPKRAACELPSSAWIDVASPVANGNWVPAEGEVLRALLEDLRARGTDFSGVFAISPFRDVARRMRPLKNDYGGLTAGTIHTAQGREADVVILVLGGNARRPDAMAWAAQKPNMLNVAVSRARRRLYVIGDRAAWSGLPHFDVLAEGLESERAVRALTEGPARR